MPVFPEAVNQFIYKLNGVEVWIKRLDLLFPHSLGNKVFKLKYNLEKAKEENWDVLLTFGGAFSNHIAATSWLAKQNGLRSIGIIRGEELGQNIAETLKQNPTLRWAHQNGMAFKFVSRSQYRLKDSAEFITELQEEFGRFYDLPEGGSNQLAVKGCEEILTEKDNLFDVIACAVGTGATISGIINATQSHQSVLAFSALKADLTQEIENYTTKTNWSYFPEIYFGGFAKINPELVSFINEFNQLYQIPLDPIYTGKMMFQLKKKIEAGHFSNNTRILAVHTGGLQGIQGMNIKLKKRGLPVLQNISKNEN